MTALNLKMRARFWIVEVHGASLDMNSRVIFPIFMSAILEWYSMVCLFLPKYSGNWLHHWSKWNLDKLLSHMYMVTFPNDLCILLVVGWRDLEICFLFPISVQLLGLRIIQSQLEASKKLSVRDLLLNYRFWRGKELENPFWWSLMRNYVGNFAINIERTPSKVTWESSEGVSCPLALCCRRCLLPIPRSQNLWANSKLIRQLLPGAESVATCLAAQCASYSVETL